MNTKKILAAILSVAALLTMTACGAKTEPAATTAAPAAAVTTAPTEAAAEAPAAEKVTGSVCLAGSTSMQKLCEAMMESFGEAYPECIEGGEAMTREEVQAHGLNYSLTHVDFMVGTADLSIVGTTHDGREIPVFVNGNFAI